MTPTQPSFYRTELRVIQNLSKDNEEFLSTVANLIARLTNERDSWMDQYNNAQRKLNELES